MQVAFLSEGATEMGLSHGMPDNEPWPHTPVLQTLVERILDAPGRIEPWQPSLLRGGGAGPILKRGRAFVKEAARAGAGAAILLVDADRKGPRRLKRLREQRQRLIEQRPKFAIPTVVGVAVETIEAWLLADERGVQTALSLDHTPSAISDPEALKGKRGSGEHPKDLLAAVLAKDSLGPRAFLEQAQAIATEVDLDALAFRCRSFHRFRDELLERLGLLFGL